MSDSNPMAAFGDFGKWVPGFDFLKGLSQPAGSAVPQMPGLGSWVAPTVNVEELDKRIQELRTVLFWLEQNVTALKATIQAMEVQKMTLNALQGMNVSMQDMAKAFSVPSPAAPAPDAASPATAPSPSPPPAPAEPAEPAAPARARRAPRSAKAPAQAAAPAPAAAALVDPMQWWGALTQQFQTIADTAVKQAKASAPDMPAGLKAAAELAEKASQSMAASADQARRRLGRAMKSGTQAWTEATQSTAKPTGRKQAGKAKTPAAPARQRTAAPKRSR